MRSVQRKVSSRGGRPVVAFSAEAVEIREQLGAKRKVIGSTRKRRELTAAQKLKLAQSLQKLRPKSG